MNVYLVALKKRLDNGDITQEVYDSMSLELAEPIKEVVEYVPSPTTEEVLADLITLLADKGVIF